MKDNLYLLTDKSAQLKLFGRFGADFSYSDIDTFLNKVREQGVKTLDVFINSTGGNMNEAYKTYLRLKDFNGSVNCYVIAVAAGVSALIAIVGGAECNIVDNANIQLQNPVNATQDIADNNVVTLQNIRDIMVNTFSSKTGIDNDKILFMMDRGTWIDVDTAIKSKFADRRVTSTFINSKFATVMQEANTVDPQANWDYDTWAKRDPKGFGDMKDKNPEKFNAIASAHLTKLRGNDDWDFDRYVSEAPEALSEMKVKEPHKYIALFEAKGNLSFSITAQGERAGWDYDKWIKNDPAGLQTMKVTAPQKHRDLLNAFSASLKAKGIME